MRKNILGSILILVLLISGCSDATKTSKKNDDALTTVLAAGLTLALLAGLSSGKKKCTPTTTATSVPVITPGRFSTGGFATLWTTTQC